MSTIAVWVLIVTYHGYSQTYPHDTYIIDNIATAQECERLARVIVPTPNDHNGTRCIQAIKVKP